VTSSWATVRPGLNPGALWVRVTAGGRILTEHGLDAFNVDAAPEFDAGYSGAALEAGAPESRVFVYDGDTGECLATLIVGGES
jgi:hypothetical protein